MMALHDKQIALEFKRRVTTLTPIRQFRVFGSRARGNTTSGSDLDVFLVVDHIDPGLREKISEVAWEVGFQNGLVLSTFVATVEQLERGALGVSPIVLQIEKEGVGL